MESLLLHIKQGAITNGAALKKFVDFLKQKDGTIELKAKRAKKRSLNQNAYYWGCVVSMIKDRMIELGNEVDSELVHDFLKDRFNSKELFTEGGTLIGSVGATTTGLTTIEFEEYMEKVKRFAAEALDLFIPDPNMPSVLFAEYKENDRITLVT